jgi:hypothetical protein
LEGLAGFVFAAARLRRHRIDKFSFIHKVNFPGRFEVNRAYAPANA